ncbi:hypothetical protein PR048_001116 [Dryococelus australis]|uniref:DUF4371 domain-containing protein n=1 Tax=Dryococelus australis TaxID=614101 RepID=A0ABQ9IIX0_9NEOP|nr:hypothetical protein PR048_001116 [Dryococelus australis]
MDKFVYKKPRVEFTENVTSLPDAKASSHIPSIALSVSSASASSQSQISVANSNQLPGKSKGRTFHKSWMTSFSWVEWDDSSDKLLELRKEDMPDIKEWMGHSSYKWLSYDIQYEIIDILRKSVLSSVVCEMKKREYFAIRVDETCDISRHEQVTFCNRSVNENLTISEDFVGLYETPNTEGKTLFGIMKDILAPLVFSSQYETPNTEGKILFGIVMNILARLDLNIENLPGQYYDGASAMSGKFKGLQKFVADLQLKATYVHCAAHSLNLAFQDCLHQLPCMRDMNLAKDLINTVRDSPKRVQLFKNITEDEKNWSSSTLPYSVDNESLQYPTKEKPIHVEEPPLPRRQCTPKRLENPCTTEPHIFFTPKDYFRQEYVCVCDTVVLCVKDRFKCTGLQKHVSVEKECVSAVIAVNNTTPKLEKTRKFFRGDLGTDRLRLHLTMLGDIAKQKRVAIIA